MHRMLAILCLIICAALASGQWLPDEDQQRLKAMWDATGVEFPGGKFYALPRVSQRLVKVVNSGALNSDGSGIYDANYQGSQNINRQLPWVTPAGLHWSPKEQWRKAALAYFPKGKEILVWRELTPVQNSLGYKQNEYRISWQFPAGTVFAEMLIRRHKGEEWVFEIRERVRGADGWKSGTTYRPYAEWHELPAETRRQALQVPPGKLRDFGLGWSDLTTYELPKLHEGRGVVRALKASRLTLTATHDEALVPRGYLSNVLRCSECHNKAGESTSYGATAIPGSDTILSWSPFTMETLNTDRYPKLDGRWPLKSVR